MTLSVERLKELVSYDPETGSMTWRVQRNTHKPAGAEVGGVWTSTKCGKQYRTVMIDGHSYGVHRLAWLYVHGSFPKGQIDHIDGDGLNNRLANLRPCTHAQNQHNRSAYKTNKSGFKGVRMAKGGRRWRAEIKINGKSKHIGQFATVEEAHAAYAKACQTYHGEFGRAA